MNTEWGLREAIRVRSAKVDGDEASGADEKSYSSRRSGAALSAPRSAYADPLMAAQWCARLLSEPPNPRYSDKDKARIHECLVRNLSELESLLDLR
jgi:hypothetical protein